MDSRSMDSRSTDSQSTDPRAIGSHCTLEQSLTRLAEGDPSAWDHVVKVFGDRLRHVARKMLRRFPRVQRYEDTDDILQGAILRLHRAVCRMAERGESPRSLMGLAATQIHRELLDLSRRYSAPSSFASNHGTNVFPIGDGERHFVDEAAVEEESLDRWEHFHAAVERLTPEQREVFQLAWYLGADQKTIAGIMGCCERTVKNHWRHARESVRAALDGERPR